MIKQEILARAMDELDDSLLMEARETVPGKRPMAFYPVPFAAIAACLVLLLTGVMTRWQENRNFPVSVCDVCISTGQCAELPLVSTAQQRTLMGMEIPLQIDTVDGHPVELSAETGSVLLDMQGEEHQKLIISEACDVWWVVDPAQRDSFELTVCWDNREVHLYAQVNPDQNTLTISQNR